MVDKMSTKRHNLHIGKNATVHRVFFREICNDTILVHVPNHKDNFLKARKENETSNYLGNQ